MHPRQSPRPWSSAPRSAKRPQPLSVPHPPKPSVEALEDRTLLNSTPVLSLPQTTFSVVKTSTLSVTASATDKDAGQILTFSLVNAPAGATITSTQVPFPGGSAANGSL